jgi:NAD-dependent DNA ligase
MLAVYCEPIMHVCSSFATSAGRSPGFSRKDVSSSLAQVGRSVLKMNVANGEGKTSKPGVLGGKVIAITGNFAKGRESVIDLVKSLGATESQTVHKRVNFLVADDGAVASQTKHIRKAVKYGVKIVSAGFLDACAESKAQIDSTPYLYQVQLSASNDDQAEE